MLRLLNKGMKMEDVIKRLVEFRDRRDWKQFHTPENLSKSIVLEAAELLENFQWNSEYNDENVREELADIMSYCILMADVLDLDMVRIIHDKIDKNEKKYPIDKSRGSSKKYTDL